MDPFSKTALKKLHRMDKPALIQMILSMSNYAEEMKMRNRVFGNLLERTKIIMTKEQKELLLSSQELKSATKENEA